MILKMLMLSHHFLKMSHLMMHHLIILDQPDRELLPPGSAEIGLTVPAPQGKEVDLIHVFINLEIEMLH